MAVHKGLLKNGKNSGHIHCVKSKRQVGKSLLIVGELLYFSINYQGVTSGCISPTLNQARKLYKEILKVTQDSGVILRKNDTILEIEFINGSVIMFKSAEQRDSLRGYTYTGILCIDECAYISDDVYSIVKPSTDVWRTPILMVSTPKFRMGFFFDTYSAGKAGNKKITSYDFNDYDTSVLLSAEALEMYRKMLPKNQFLTEYLGEFMDSDSSVFSGFKECVKTKGNADYKQLYIGIDWGNGTNNDDTVVIGLDENGEQQILTYFNNKNTTQQITYIVEYLRPFLPKIKVILCECNSLGKPLTELLRTEFVKLTHKNFVEDWTTTNESKARIVNQLQVAFENKHILLINDEKQTAELSMYEATYNMKTGNVSYNAPMGGNDDICIALCLAYEALKMKNKRGNYNLFIV